MANLDSILKSRDITLPTRSIQLKLCFFQESCMDVRVGPYRKLSAKELMLWNLMLEKTLESPLDSKEIQPVHPKGNQFSSVTQSCPTLCDPMNLLGSPCSPRDSQESSPTPQFKSINSLVLNFLRSSTLTSIHDHWKNHSLDQMDLVGKVLSLLFNMLSAAAAKSLQSCPTLCTPRDSSPPGSSVHGICQARVLEWVVIAFSNMLSRLVLTFLPSSKRTCRAANNQGRQRTYF